MEVKEKIYIEFNINEFDVKEYVKDKGYEIDDFDDGDDKCVKIYSIVDVENGEEGCYVGCLMESGKYWVVGCRIDRVVNSYEEMIKYIKGGI